jgi:hypothetical protein
VGSWEKVLNCGLSFIKPVCKEVSSINLLPLCFLLLPIWLYVLSLGVDLGTITLRWDTSSHTSVRSRLVGRLHISHKKIIIR